MEKEYLMTAEGKNALEARLDEIKTKEMPRVLEDIKTARAQGDLSENYEYTAAREQQEKLMLEISDIEERLKYHKIIDERELPKDVVAVGSVVDVLECDLMVSPDEDPDEKSPAQKSDLTGCGFTAADVVSAYMESFGYTEAEAKSVAFLHGFADADFTEGKRDKKAEKELIKKTRKYKIVGSHEANPLAADLPCISNESRVGVALQGKRLGESFIVGVHHQDEGASVIDGVLFRVMGINEKR